MKKIIVTGGSGFIGTNLVNFLLEKKFFVINLDKLTYSSNKYNLKHKKNYRFFKIDINNQKKLLSIFKKFKPVAVFNLAAETHVDRSIDNPKQFIYSNFVGVFNLLEALRKYNNKNKKIKLIHISTDEVYGDIKPNIRSNENFKFNPSSPYSASKAGADHLVSSYVKTFNLPAVISNCCNNYGPYQFPEKLIPKIISNILNNRSLPLYGNGLNSREWIYVTDHCQALYVLYLKGKNGESYNVGSNINLRNIDLARTMIKIFNKKNIKIGKKVKIQFVKDRPGHDFRYALDNKKIKTNLKWKPVTKISEGLMQTINWYLNNKFFTSSISKKLYVKRLGLNQ